jgi:hypothetical protein
MHTIGGSPSLGVAWKKSKQKGELSISKDGNDDINNIKSSRAQSNYAKLLCFSRAPRRVIVNYD